MYLIHATIMTMEDRSTQEHNPFIHDGYLKIEGSKIAALGSMTDFPKILDPDETLLDIKGNTIYPGFVDAHCHMGMAEEGLGFEGDDLNESTDPITPQLRGLDAVNPNNPSFPEAWKAAVTTVVTGPGSANPIAGQFCAIKTYGTNVDKMLLKAPIAMKFALGENPKGNYAEKSQSPMTRMATAALIRAELHKAQRYLNDLRKAEESRLKADEDEEIEEIDPPEFDPKCEALIPVLKREIKAHFHCHRADDIYTALRIAKEFSLDCVLVHCTEGYLIKEDLAAEHAQVITGPLMTTRTKPELSRSTDANPGLLSRAGVCTAICTDYNVLPISLLPISAGMAVREGMPWEEAMRAITINPAKICALDEQVGSLRPGKDADLSVFDCDPLTLSAKPLLVMINGKIIVNTSASES